MTLKERIEQWEKSPFDESTIAEVDTLRQNPTELEDAFYTDVAFGTGGMRGIMGAGTNRINRYTLGKASQGLANYLNARFKNIAPKIVIAYDCRNNSDTFAKAVAKVFSANNIDTYLFSSLRPTPVLSYAVRQLEAQAGIVLTASHNPPEYNGYKVYNQHGGQIVPPEDKQIVQHIEALNFSDIRWEENAALIHNIDKEVDEVYADTVVRKSLLTEAERQKTSVVFTSLHGTAIATMPTVFEKAGYTITHWVDEQSEPNGNFPTVVSPNPEEKEAFTLALKKAKEVNADIILGTDPDADRLGIGVKNLNGEWTLLNGNQLMVVLTRFVLENSSISSKNFIASTVVSTPMMIKMAEAFNVECKLGLTGFKWIAKMIQDFPEQTFLCGGEESYGYLFGHDVRDKDAISAALLACDLQAHLAAKGSSIYAYLIDSYQRYGCFHEDLVSVTKKGKKGAEEIDALMHDFRNNTPTTIAGIAVITFDDFLAGTSTSVTGKKQAIGLPPANVLRFHLEDGSTIAVRPSGTEPKIKYYFSVNTPLDKASNYAAIQEQLKQKCQLLINVFTF
jgi:phosphoglucomutase